MCAGDNVVSRDPGTFVWQEREWGGSGSECWEMVLTEHAGGKKEDREPWWKDGEMGALRAYPAKERRGDRRSPRKLPSLGRLAELSRSVSL